MQGGLRACPQCGNVNDAAATSCTRCAYNFETGERGPEIPRILADDDNIIRRGPTPRRGVIVAVFALSVFVFGFVAFMLLGVDTETGPAGPSVGPLEFRERQLIELPTLSNDAPTFTRASCTRALQRAVEELLHRQARQRPLDRLFKKFTRFGVGSFEYRALLRVYASLDVQMELTTEGLNPAVALARRNAAQECRRRYGA